MAEQLAAWRKAYTEKEKLEKEASKTACQKLATDITRGLLKRMPPKSTTIGVDFEPVYEVIGKCKFNDFEPIMRQQCLKTFGENCKVTQEYQTAGPFFGAATKEAPAKWQVEFDVQLKY